MPQIVWIALGGAAGTIARHLVGQWLLSAMGPSFPYGTLAVNLVGSTLLGLLYALSSTSLLGPTTMLALTTGFMGGFTTYSTFSLDTFKLAQAGAWPVAAAYVAVTLLGGFAGTAAGYVVGGRLFPSTAP